MIDTTPKPPVNLSPDPLEDLPFQTRSDYRVLQALDDDSPDVESLARTVLYFYRNSVPSWLKSHLRLTGYLSLVDEIAAALGSVYRLLRVPPRHARSGQVFLDYPRFFPFDLPPRHLKAN